MILDNQVKFKNKVQWIANAKLLMNSFGNVQRKWALKKIQKKVRSNSIKDQKKKSSRKEKKLIIFTLPKKIFVISFQNLLIIIFAV